MKLTKTIAYALMVGLALSQTACLKTRAQLKNEGDQSGDAAQDEAAKQGIPQKPSNYEMEEIKSEVTRLSGRLDEIDHNSRNQPSATDLKEYVTRIDARVADLEKNQMLVMSELKALKDKSAADEQAAQAAATPPTDLLTKANQLLSEKKCDEAEDAFKQILARNGLKPKEAADAHFGAAEAEYCKKDYKKAILEYSAVRKANPKSAKVPPSLYRIGLAFNHLNMAEEAKGFFNEVIEKYPNSAEAKKAKARVKE